MPPRNKFYLFIVFLSLTAAQTISAFDLIFDVTLLKVHYEKLLVGKADDEAETLREKLKLVEALSTPALRRQLNIHDEALQPLFIDLARDYEGLMPKDELDSIPVELRDDFTEVIVRHFKSTPVQRLAGGVNGAFKQGNLVIKRGIPLRNFFQALFKSFPSAFFVGKFYDRALVSEALAYEIAKVMGLEQYVPKAFYLRSLREGKPYAFLEFLEGFVPLKKLSTAQKKAFQRELAVNPILATDLSFLTLILGHVDLHDENIMIRMPQRAGERIQVKIIDFGLTLPRTNQGIKHKVPVLVELLKMGKVIPIVNKDHLRERLAGFEDEQIRILALIEDRFSGLVQASPQLYRVQQKCKVTVGRMGEISAHPHTEGVINALLQRAKHVHQLIQNDGAISLTQLMAPLLDQRLAQFDQKVLKETAEIARQIERMRPGSYYEGPTVQELLADFQDREISEGTSSSAAEEATVPDATAPVAVEPVELEVSAAPLEIVFLPAPPTEESVSTTSVKTPISKATTTASNQKLEDGLNLLLEAYGGESGTMDGPIDGGTGPVPPIGYDI